ncbi:hypothetical protein A7982_13604 [Minicystis rosea]|nr:hypothetical protein A7982_13604 [Minicystis rosea]
MLRRWHLATALKDVLLIAGPGPAPEGATPLGKTAAIWHLSTWAENATFRHVLHEIGDYLESFRPSPVHAEDDGGLETILRKALLDGRLRAFALPRPALAAVAVEKTAGPPHPRPTPLARVNPIIKPATTVVVVAKKARNPSNHRVEAYTHPMRQPIQLSTDGPFDGTGTFTCSQPTLVRFWSAPTGGHEIHFDGHDNVFRHGSPPRWAHGATLVGGVTVYAEGATPSLRMDDITITLALTGGSRPRGPDDTATLTSVELTLEICRPRPAAGAAPPQLSTDDKVHVGRDILVQDAGNHFERAMLIIKPVRPPTFTGRLVLQALNAEVTAFANETPKVGEFSALPFTIAASAIGAGHEIWAQGAHPSTAMRTTGFQLGIVGVDPDGDRVTATAVQLTLDICKSRTAAGVDPVPLTAADKVAVGRFVHEQDANNHHGRALLIVRKTLPDTYDGTVVLKAITANTELYPNELPTSGEAVIASGHEIDYRTAKNEDTKFWVQGKKVSGALRDAGYTLHLKHDNPKSADTVSVTVCKFSQLQAQIRATPPLTSRSGNAAASHSYTIAGAATNDWDRDDANNPALVLVEGSVLSTSDAHKIQLSVNVAPTGVPVRWFVQRDVRPAPKGDHATLISAFPTPTRPVPDAANPLHARMIADGVGTFHILPFVDCNGGDSFDFAVDIQPHLVMNLILIRVQGRSNASVPGTSAQVLPAAPTSATGIGVYTGGQTPATAGAYSIATVAVTGGGQDGLRGLNRLFAGWSQHIVATPTSASVPQGIDIFGQYQVSMPPLLSSIIPPTFHQAFFVLAPPPASVLTPPVPVSCPVLDCSNQTTGGTGGDTGTGQWGGIGPLTTPMPTVTKALGQEWTVDTSDSPGLPLPSGVLMSATHPLGGNLVAFRFNLDFRVDLLFWTNMTSSSGATNSPAERLYASVQTNHWFVRFALNFDPTTGAPIGPIPPVAITMKKDTNPLRLATPVEGSGLEVRFPVALNLLRVDNTT